MKERIVIVVGGFGTANINLYDLKQAEQILIVATKKSAEDVRSILDNIRMMNDHGVINDNGKVHLIEKIQELKQAFIPSQPKPHKDRYYQRHCRRNKWK